MTEPYSDEEIVARFQDEPAPFLAWLHGFMARDGLLSFGAVRATGEAMDKSPGALGVLLDYYKKFPKEGIDSPCFPLPLDPIGVPAPSPAEVEECVFRSIRIPGRKTLEGYRGSGGYHALEKCLDQGTPQDLIETISSSGLRGRGGAGFPTGKKWRLTAEATGDSKFVVCNGDEGDPGSFKDRTLLELDPHAIIEGMALAGYATGASIGLIYLRNDYTPAENVLRAALKEARDASLLGESILESDFSFSIYVRKGAGTYVCGEETVLLNTLEGNYPFPRIRPPHPSTRGFDNCPTVVNNVETFAVVPQIVNRGPLWYGELGLGQHAGTRLVSLTGDVARPGCYEIPAGLRLDELLDTWAGGAADGSPIQAVSMAGVAGGFLRSDAFDVEIDDASLRERGSLLGNGAIAAFDTSRDLVQVAKERFGFFKEQTCFKCEVCVVGVDDLEEAFDFGQKNESFESWCTRVEATSDSMKRDGVCGFADEAARTAMTMVEHFKSLLEPRFGR